MNTVISFAALLERFFTQRLMQQRQASPHTISSYRDTFCQFLKFTEQRLHKAPSRLTFEEIDAPLIDAPLITADCNTLVVSICGLRGTGSFCTDPARACHPRQALYTDSGPIPHT